MDKFDELLDHAIKLHAEYHTGGNGLSDKGFKETIKQLVKELL